MAEPQYDLYYSGQVLEGQHVDFVKADIQQLFKADQAYVDRLFSGTQQTIKQGVDKATAIKFQQAFKKAGAKLIVRPHGSQPAQSKSNVSTATIAEARPERAAQAVNATEPTNSSTITPSSLSPSNSSAFQTTMEAIDGENADSLVAHHQPDIQTPQAIPDWGVSEPGAQIGEETQFVPAVIDTSDLTVAETGADLIVHHGFEEPIPVINTDSMTLAEPGTTLDTLDDKPKPVQVDISHLSVE